MLKGRPEPLPALGHGTAVAAPPHRLVGLIPIGTGNRADEDGRARLQGHDYQVPRLHAMDEGAQLARQLMRVFSFSPG